MSGRSHRFLGITSTFWEVNVSCSRIQHGDLSEDRTSGSEKLAAWQNEFGKVSSLAAWQSEIGKVSSMAVRLIKW